MVLNLNQVCDFIHMNSPIDFSRSTNVFKVKYVPKCLQNQSSRFVTEVIIPAESDFYSRVMSILQLLLQTSLFLNSYSSQFPRVDKALVKVQPSVPASPREGECMRTGLLSPGPCHKHISLLQQPLGGTVIASKVVTCFIPLLTSRAILGPVLI